MIGQDRQEQSAPARVVEIQLLDAVIANTPATAGRRRRLEISGTISLQGNEIRAAKRAAPKKKLIPIRICMGCGLHCTSEDREIPYFGHPYVEHSYYQ